MYTVDSTTLLRKTASSLYNLTYSNYTETIANIGAVENNNPLLIGITGDSFVDLGTGVLTAGQVTITGAPTGLTPILTLTSATIAALTFTGVAVNQEEEDNFFRQH